MKNLLFILSSSILLTSCATSSLSTQSIVPKKHNIEESVNIINNQEMFIKIRNLVESYGGELIGTDFNAKTYKSYAIVHFPKGKPNATTLTKMSAELSKLTDLDMTVKVSLTQLIL